MDTLRSIIYDQNKDLLERIADDKYIDEKDKNNFVKKYHKKNFTFLKVTKRDPTPKYIKKLIKCVK
tara:strand:- start:2809 stop:3006 length:198 start_codon:yes stop_codon:yes gene_type:complete